MGVVPGEDAYSIPFLARLLHSLPHLNVSLHQVNNSFDPNSPVYLESLGILGSIPAAWLILTLLVLLIYLLTRCCDRKPRPSRSITALKITLSIISVLCCSTIGLGLYGNDDLHNGIIQLLDESKKIDLLVMKIRNQTELIERQLRIQINSQLISLNDVFDDPVTNMTLYKQSLIYLKRTIENNTMAANAIADIRQPMIGLNLQLKLIIIERIESIRWPLTMSILSILLILCIILLVGIVRHNRCALIAFSVSGLLAIIISYLMSSVYLSTSIAISDLCIQPDKFIEQQTTNELTKEILRYYINCERARANPFTQRLREAKTTIENIRLNLNVLKQPAVYLFPKKNLEMKFNSLKNEINSIDTILTSLTASVDCRTLNSHYLRGIRSLCNLGLLGLTLMLLSSILTGLLLTALVWIDSHTWIYIRKKKDYHQVNENDPYLPPPQASQAIAARTLQRSQGSSYPPDTPPPSYSSALTYNRPHASAPLPHEAQLLLDGCDMRPSEHHHRGGGGGGGTSSSTTSSAAAAHMSHLRGHTLGRLPSHHHEPALAGPNNGKAACKEFPNFKGFKFDQRQQQQQQQHPPQRTANIQKFSSLGRRPLPQTPDEKLRMLNNKNQPIIIPKIPAISQNIEIPLNPSNFRSLQRGAWQDSNLMTATSPAIPPPPTTTSSTTTPVASSLQFRSLQRNNYHHNSGSVVGSGSGNIGISTIQPNLPISQFRSIKIQDQAQNEVLYANSDSERQLYAVTEL